MPVLPADDRGSALSLAGRERDGRARHFWAPSRSFGLAWGKRHPPQGEALAWDVVMLFDRGVRWRAGSLPEPRLVRYPAGMNPSGEPAFDADELRAAVEAALAEPRP